MKLYFSTPTRQFAALGLAATMLVLSSASAWAGPACKRNCDTVAPSVNVTAPTAGSIVAGTITISGTSADNVSVAKVEVAVDGGAYQLATGTTTWSRNWSTTAVSNTGHTLSVRATDGSGNAKTTTETVTVANPVADVTAPSVTISAPVASASVSGSVAVAGTAADNIALARVDVSVDGGAWQAASGTSSWSWTWAASAVPNGSHTLAARSVDTSGNSATSSVSVTVANPVADVVAPSVVISAPAAGGTVAGSVAVSGTAGDNVGVTKVEVAVDGGAWQAATGTSSWAWTWSTGSVANGSHTVTTRASDAAGNTQTVGVTVTVTNSGSSWVSPEGVHINVNSAGPWTVAQIYDLLRQNARDLDKLGPNLTVNVQDVYASVTSVSASSTDGRYTNWVGTIYLKGVNSNFASNPDAVLAHEYGHAWTLYHLYLSQQGDWTAYLQARGIANDARLDTTYNWDRREIIADDYRLLFGTAAAISEMPNHLNAALPDPRTVAGLRDFFVNEWSVAKP